MAGVFAPGSLVDHTADRAGKAAAVDAIQNHFGDCKLAFDGFSTGFEVQCFREAAPFAPTCGFGLGFEPGFVVTNTRSARIGRRCGLWDSCDELGQVGGIGLFQGALLHRHQAFCFDMGAVCHGRLNGKNAREYTGANKGRNKAQGSDHLPSQHVSHLKKRSPATKPGIHTKFFKLRKPGQIWGAKLQLSAYFVGDR